jgi:large repetitive protein
VLWASCAATLDRVGRHIRCAGALAILGLACSAASPGATMAADTVPPDTAIVSGPAGPTGDTTPTFTFSSDEPNSTFECNLDSGGFAPCNSANAEGPGGTTGSFTPASALPDGPHAFSVRATDAANNTDPSEAQADFSVDSLAPDTWIVSAPPVVTASPDAVITYGSDDPGASFECSIDAIVFKPCDAGGKAYPNLYIGWHFFEVRARDAAGNTDATPAQSIFFVDYIAPQTYIFRGPAGRTRDRRPKFGFRGDEVGVVLLCRLDRKPAFACTSPLRTRRLSFGRHVFRVTAFDLAGNGDPTPAVRHFKVKRRR